MTKEDIEQETNKFIEVCMQQNGNCNKCPLNLKCNPEKDRELDKEKDKKKKQTY